VSRFLEVCTPFADCPLCVVVMADPLPPLCPPLCGVVVAYFVWDWFWFLPPLFWFEYPRWLLCHSPSVSVGLTIVVSSMSTTSELFIYLFIWRHGKQTYSDWW
jgi:hypothetical protein